MAAGIVDLLKSSTSSMNKRPAGLCAASGQCFPGQPCGCTSRSGRRFQKYAKAALPGAFVCRYPSPCRKPWSALPFVSIAGLHHNQIPVAPAAATRACACLCARGRRPQCPRWRRGPPSWIYPASIPPTKFCSGHSPTRNSARVGGKADGIAFQIVIKQNRVRKLF